MNPPIPHVTDADIRRMAREAEAENLTLPLAERKPRGWHFRRASLRLGTLPLAETSVDELAWLLAVRMANCRGV